MSSFFYPPAHGPSQQLRSSLPSPLPHDTRLKIFAFVIPLFVSFIPLKYLNTDFNPHASHPSTIKAFIYISTVFFVSSIAEAKFNLAADNIYGLVCGHISEFAAILAVMLIASIGFPAPLTWFDYIAFTFLLICAFLILLDWLRRWFYEKTRKAVQFALECLYDGLMMPILVRYCRLQHQDRSTLLPISSTNISMVRTPRCYFNFMLKNHCSNEGLRQKVMYIYVKTFLERWFEPFNTNQALTNPPSHLYEFARSPSLILSNWTKLFHSFNDTSIWLSSIFTWFLTLYYVIMIDAEHGSWSVTLYVF